MAKSARQYEMNMTEGPLLGKILRFSLPLAVTGILQLLYNAGFRDITLDKDVSDRIFANPDKFYNPTRMFIITAEK